MKCCQVMYVVICIYSSYSMLAAMYVSLHREHMHSDHHDTRRRQNKDLEEISVWRRLYVNDEMFKAMYVNLRITLTQYLYERHWMDGDCRFQLWLLDRLYVLNHSHPFCRIFLLGRHYASAFGGKPCIVRIRTEVNGVNLTTPSWITRIETVGSSPLWPEHIYI